MLCTGVDALLLCFQTDLNCIHSFLSSQERTLMLGMRLLMPRYRLRIIESHLNYLTRMDLGRLKIVPDYLWKPLVHQDYFRSQVEDNKSKNDRQVNTRDFEMFDSTHYL